MIVFFIIVSLMLNVLSLLAIIILFLRQNKIMKIEERQKAAIKEMEEIISSYILEMKDENERFIKGVKQMNEERDKQKFPFKETKSEHKNFNNSNGKTVEKTAGFEKHKNSQAIKAYQIQNKKHQGTDSIQEPLNENIFQGYKEIEEDCVNMNDNVIVEKKIDQEKPLLEQILSLQKQGLTEEEMAKKLNKGKTEIALLLKFRGNKQ